jgi:hypothetical protein
MKLTSSKAEEYPKFQTVGDTVKGDFLSYERAVIGKFGPENLLTLRGEHAQRIVVRATTTLASILDENATQLEGKHMTIKLVALRPTNKGSPMKIYDVEIDSNEPPPPFESSDTSDANENGMPF